VRPTMTTTHPVMDGFAGPFADPDRYHLGELVSRGPDGELWRGTTSVTGQTVPIAAKVLRPSADPATGGPVDQLNQEASLRRQLHHPNVATVRELFEGPPVHPPGSADPGQRAWYLVLDWAEGERLSHWVARNPVRDPLTGTRMVTRLVGVVEHLHHGSDGGSSLVRCDVRPANIIVDEASGELRLLDFSLVQVSGAEGSSPAGALAYTAPEVLAGAPATEASDRFSVGATTYYLFTGEHPDHTDPAGMRARLQAVAGIVDHAGFAEHVLALCDEDPRRRPADLVAWAQTLAVGSVSDRFPAADPTPASPQPSPRPRPAAVGEPVPAPREPAPPKTRKRRGRRPLIAVGVLAVIALVAGALFVLRTGADSPGASVDAGAPGAESPAYSSTTSPAIVPSVEGQTLASARSSLERDGFVVRVDYQESPRARDTVLRQVPASGATAPDGTVTLTVAKPPTTTPGVVDQQLSSATASLEAIGVKVKTQDVLDETTPDGQVTAQEPAAGTTMPTEITLTVARRPQIVYLSTMSSVEGDAAAVQAVTISGTPYTRSVRQGGYSLRSDGRPMSAGYDLGRIYHRFRATAGLVDSSPSGAQVKLEVLGDGRPLFSQIVGLGQTEPVDVDVTGILRLTISTSYVGNSESSYTSTSYTYGAWGDAQLLTTQAQAASRPSTSTTR
jgi:beta-lactam-binding protein with PASTA domain